MDYIKQIKHLRELGAPEWVIKITQLNLLLSRKGLKGIRLGKPTASFAGALFDKHVKPLME